MYLSTISRTIIRTSINISACLSKLASIHHPVVRETVRPFSVALINRCKEDPAPDEEVSVKDPSKDRTKVIPLETSIRYLDSSAYTETYGSEPVWKLYRRNHKGMFPPRKTRKTCIRKGQISTGNACPICRDEYLVLKAENVKLLKQFISPYTGEILSYTTTGICQKKHMELLIAIELAKDRGLIEFDIPLRVYDYSLYKEN